MAKLKKKSVDKLSLIKKCIKEREGIPQNAKFSCNDVLEYIVDVYYEHCVQYGYIPDLQEVTKELYKERGIYV